MVCHSRPRISATWLTSCRLWQRNPSPSWLPPPPALNTAVVLAPAWRDRVRSSPWADITRWSSGNPRPPYRGSGEFRRLRPVLRKRRKRRLSENQSNKRAASGGGVSRGFGQQARLTYTRATTPQAPASDERAREETRAIWLRCSGTSARFRADPVPARAFPCAPCCA